ncbi:MAG: hypothetical protein GY942_25120 [Aestuariibacter sp.]|nr:hypothetical protein [Aestuariibacter sp.]
MLADMGLLDAAAERTMGNGLVAENGVGERPLASGAVGGGCEEGKAGVVLATAGCGFTKGRDDGANGGAAVGWGLLATTGAGFSWLGASGVFVVTTGIVGAAGVAFCEATTTIEELLADDVWLTGVPIALALGAVGNGGGETAVGGARASSAVTMGSGNSAMGSAAACGFGATVMGSLVGTVAAGGWDTVCCG